MQKSLPAGKEGKNGQRRKRGTETKMKEWRREGKNRDPPTKSICPTRTQGGEISIELSLSKKKNQQNKQQQNQSTNRIKQHHRDVVVGREGFSNWEI